MESSINRRQFLGATAAAALGLSAPAPGKSDEVPGKSAAPPTPTLWPQDRAAALSLTFDDAMYTQLDNAAPVMRQYSLKGTFFVITGPTSTWLKRNADWRRLSAEGNEIASHTVNHPCIWKGARFPSQQYTPEMMHREMKDSYQDIAERVGAERGLTFAYPCDDATFGPPGAQARNQALYMSYVAEYYFAARGVCFSGSVPRDEMNPLTLPSLGAHGMDVPDLLRVVEPLMQGHKWGILCFHGVGGQYISTSAETFQGLAKYLHEHSEIWVGTLGDVMRYIQETKAFDARMEDSDGNSFRFALTWPLDRKIYDLPLTLKWPLPDSWASCDVEADGRPLRCSMVEDTGVKTAHVDVPAQTKTLQFQVRSE